MRKIIPLFTLILFITFFPVSRGFCDEVEKGRAYYDFGVFDYSDGAYEKAEANFKKALSLEPENPYYNHFLGKTYIKMKRLKEAGKYLDKAWSIDRTIGGLSYDRALFLFKTNDFEGAFQLFEDIAKKDPLNVLAQYYAGMSLYKMERYREALGFFVGAAEKSPSIGANGYYHAGICAFKTGRNQKAIDLFTTARETTDSEPLRENINSWIKTIEKRAKRFPRLALFAKLGIRYDDNVILDPNDEDLSSGKDESDTAIIGFFSGKYDFLTRDTLTIGAGYSHYQSKFFDLSRYDMTGVLPNVYGKYRLKKMTFGLTCTPSYYWLESDNYLRRIGINAFGSWRMTDKIAARFMYRFFDDHYFDDDKWSGKTHGIGADAYLFLLNGTLRLSCGLSYDDNSAESPDQYNGKTTAGVGADILLPLAFKLGASFEFQDRNYDHADRNGITRDDGRYRGRLKISTSIFSERIGIIGEYEYTKNDSNKPEFDYERNMFTLSLTAAY